MLKKIAEVGSMIGALNAVLLALFVGCMLFIAYASFGKVVHQTEAETAVSNAVHSR